MDLPSWMFVNCSRGYLWPHSHIVTILIQIRCQFTRAISCCCRHALRRSRTRAPPDAAAGSSAPCIALGRRNMSDPLETLAVGCDGSGEDADPPDANKEIPTGLAAARGLRKRASANGQHAPQPSGEQWPAHIIVRPPPSRELTCSGCGAHALFNDLPAACYLRSPLLTCGVSVLGLHLPGTKRALDACFPKRPLKLISGKSCAPVGHSGAVTDMMPCMVDSPCACDCGCLCARGATCLYG